MIALAALLLTTTGFVPLPAAPDSVPLPATAGFAPRPATPGSAPLSVTTGQCNGRDLVVRLSNPGRKAIYSDTTLAAPGELHLPRTLISSWLPPGYSTTVPVVVTAATGTRPGIYHVRVTSAGRTVDVPVRVSAPAANAGLMALASTVTASSARAGSTACAAIDGKADTMWNDTTGKRWPDWWRIDWPSAHQVSAVEVTTSKNWGLRDWDVQVAGPGGWVTVASVRANALDRKMTTFAPRRTTALRIVTLAGNAVNDQSRLVEVVIRGR
ncbi:galactose-binding domain-containing protein [Actinoplanes sp. HUAS TT8]|uniref:galactose-binding domain-containing protein n=1 Tax=Actinoplanes sp. HUAS TT8 TaxID=3447453 RepID=UPI003F51D37D